MAFRGGTVAISLLSFLALSRCQEISVHFTVFPNQNVELGEDFSLECRVENLIHGRPGLIIKWWKRQGNETINIGSNDSPNEYTDDFSRYAGSWRSDSPDVTYVMKIKGAVARDSGEFGCSIAQMNTIREFKRVEVLVPVNTVRLFAMQSNLTTEPPQRAYSDGETVNFVEGHPYYFRCVVSGSNPQPEVTFSSGDTAMTHLFSSDVRRRTTGASRALRDVSYVTVLTMTTPLVASWDINGRQIHCTAHVAHTQSVSIYITAKLTFEPKLECPSVLLVDLHAEDVELVCRVRSHPGVEHVVWSWSTGDGVSVFLHPGDVDGHYESVVKEGEGDASDEKLIKLYMHKVYSQMFRSYYVKVTSSAGEATAEIQLGRATQHGSTEDASNANFPSLMLVFSLALLLSSIA